MDIATARKIVQLDEKRNQILNTRRWLETALFEVDFQRIGRNIYGSLTTALEMDESDLRRETKNFLLGKMDERIKQLDAQLKELTE